MIPFAERLNFFKNLLEACPSWTCHVVFARIQAARRLVSVLLRIARTGEEFVVNSLTVVTGLLAVTCVDVTFIARPLLGAGIVIAITRSKWLPDVLTKPLLALLAATADVFHRIRGRDIACRLIPKVRVVITRRLDRLALFSVCGDYTFFSVFVFNSFCGDASIDRSTAFLFVILVKVAISDTYLSAAARFLAKVFGNASGTIRRVDVTVSGAI